MTGTVPGGPEQREARPPGVGGRDRVDGAESCPVCGGPLSPEAGSLLRHRGAWVRFRCSDCAAEFERKPERYLARI